MKKRFRYIGIPAFTLLEVLVLVAILALLLVLWIPAFQKVKYNAKQSICESKCKYWGIAISKYVNDNDGYYPARYWPYAYPDQTYDVYSWPYQYSQRGRFDLVKTLIAPYMGGQEHTWCPFVPDNLASHLSYEEQKRRSDERQRKNPGGPSGGYTVGDYAICLGYPAYIQRGVDPKGPYVTERIVKWGSFRPPEKAQLAKPAMTIVGDRVAEFDLKKPTPWLYNHPFKKKYNKTKPTGMTCVSADLSVEWVRWNDMAVFLHCNKGDYRFYWANPDR